MLAHDAAPLPGVDAASSGLGAHVLARELALEAGGVDGMVGAERRPERIGQYRIIRRIGASGMGMTYEAQQEEPCRRVALKVIRSSLVMPGTLRRFRKEVAVLAQLNHPGIARIFASELDGDGNAGVPFFAMELVEGRPLMHYAAAEVAAVPETERN
jgi:serine/threonine protein kinase